MKVEDQAIALIGLGLRFPGGAHDADSAWRFLCRGGDAIGEVPPERWDADAHYSPDRDAPGKMYSRQGGFLRDVDMFDAAFFGISPREATSLDPQQRLVVEVAWEALEVAGVVPAQLAGSKTGVYVGVMNDEYADRLATPGDWSRIDSFYATGNQLSFASGRLSYILGLRGPSMSIATACSSSLIAVHQACQSLRVAECNLALAGGVSLLLSPELNVYMSKAQAIAPDGRCKTFDAHADGIVRSEGCGMVVLQRLSDAIASRRNILAIIRGSAINHDGASAGITVPSCGAQQELLSTALANAGVEPAAIDYVEAHGTGTPLGDRIELRALATVLGRGRAPERPLALGSIKTNLGHLDAAAGIAGLIKVVLALQHRTIPPHLHLREPNPDIADNAYPITIPTAVSPWPRDQGTAMAGVSAFGLSGASAHVILEEPPRRTSEARARDDQTRARPHVLVMSARTTEGVRQLADAYRASLSSNIKLHDACYTAAVHRTHFDHRVAVLGTSREEMIGRLDAFVQDRTSPGLVTGEGPCRSPGVVFVFSGQGSQWAGMGRQLCRTQPRFRMALEACDQQISRLAGWSLLEQLERDAPASRLDRTEVAQPAILAVQVALVELWRAWGIEPSAIVGHSVGEIAAAHVAGMLDLEDALTIAVHRGRRMAGAHGHGKMAAVALCEQRARDLLGPLSSRVAIAAINSPTSVVLSGEVDSLDAALERLEAEQVAHRRLEGHYAFHSPQMEPCLAALEHDLTGITPRPARVPVISTLTGAPADEQAYSASYWRRNVRETVRFGAAIEHLIGQGYRIFLELGPHAVLCPSILQCLEAADHARGHAVPSLRRGPTEAATLMQAVARLHTLGLPINWGEVLGGQGDCVPLPTYPWQKQRFWVDWDPTQAGARASGSPSPALVDSTLGEPVRLATQPGTYCWEARVCSEEIPYLHDHRVGSQVVFPGTGYIDVALRAASAYGAEDLALRRIMFLQPLVLDRAHRLQVVVSPGASGEALIKVFARPEQDPTSGWTLHAEATLVPGARAPRPPCPDLRTQPQPTLPEVALEHHYTQMERGGLHYGPSFRALTALWQDGDQALGRIQRPQGALTPAGVRLSLLDGCFGVLRAATRGKRETTTATHVPIEVAELALFDAIDGDLWCHATVQPPARDGRDLVGDIVLFRSEGTVVAVARGVRLQRLRSARDEDTIGLFRVQWDHDPAPGAPDRPPEATKWLLFADQVGVAQHLADILETRGHQCIRVSPAAHFAELSPTRYRVDPSRPADFERLLARIVEPTATHSLRVVHLWGIDRATSEPVEVADLEAEIERTCGSILHLGQGLMTTEPRLHAQLLVVTRNANAIGEGPTLPLQGSAWALCKVIANELPELRCRAIDLSAEPSAEEIQGLAAELDRDDGQRQVALRGKHRYVAKLQRASARELARPANGDAGAVRSPPTGPFQLELSASGMLENLRLTTQPRRQPGPGEVELCVHRAGLNFRDVLQAMGRYPGASDSLELGVECAGIISAVGEDVDTLAPGDHVIAIAPSCFRSHVIVPAALVCPKPDELTFDDAASIPINYTTAYYGLETLGRLKPGERVLIHSAAGGTGLAAVHIARRIGAKVFATAGTEEKREFLRTLGLEYVTDSRSLGFADEVLQQTAGEGVDVVFNSLAGAGLVRGFSVLAPYGRFVDISRRDIYENTALGLAPFRANLSYSAIDLRTMIDDTPQRFGELLREVVAWVATGEIERLPVKTLPIEQAPTAFRTLAGGRHIGKIVLSFPAPDADSTARPQVRPRGERTTLITGGLGGIGLQVAQWLVERGECDLVLLGRSAPSPQAQRTIELLQRSGARVHVQRCDVAEPREVSDALAEIRRTMPRLRRLFHCAGVLEDGTLLGLRLEHFHRVMAPKVLGTWNLHHLTRHDALDQFVMFSSASSLLGLPGQGNYAAANGFMDALALHRRAMGLPAMSIQWGAWSEVGMAVSSEQQRRLSGQGLDSMTPAQALSALELALSQDWAAIGVTPFDLRRWCDAHPLGAHDPFLAPLSDDTRARATAQAPAVASTFATLETLLERRAFVRSHVQEQVGQVLQIPPPSVDCTATLQSLGLDSLLSLELHNRLDASLGVRLPATLVWTYSTVDALAQHLFDALQGGADAPVHEARARPEPELTELSTMIAQLDELSEEEALQMLANAQGAE